MNIDLSLDHEVFREGHDGTSCWDPVGIILLENLLNNQRIDYCRLETLGFRLCMKVRYPWPDLAGDFQTNFLSGARIGYDASPLLSDFNPYGSFLPSYSKECRLFRRGEGNVRKETEMCFSQKLIPRGQRRETRPAALKPQFPSHG